MPPDAESFLFFSASRSWFRECHLCLAAVCSREKCKCPQMAAKSLDLGVVCLDATVSRPVVMLAQRFVNLEVVSDQCSVVSLQQSASGALACTMPPRDKGTGSMPILREHAYPVKAEKSKTAVHDSRTHGCVARDVAGADVFTSEAANPGGPCGPLPPCGPMGPCGPRGPAGPCAPCGPGGPCEPT